MPTLEVHKITEADAVFDQLKAEDLLPGEGPIAAFRQEALERFKALGIPNTHQEEWRFTNVAPIAAADLAVATPGDGDPAELLGQMEAEGLLQITDALAVVVNGFFRPDLSRLDVLPGEITFSSFAQGGLENETARKYLGKIAADPEHPFMALNSALFSDGLFIHVPRNVVVTEPLHVVFLTTNTSSPLLSNPRMLVVLEESSELRLVETYYGPEKAAYFTNSVVEFDVEDNAKLDHYRVNLEGKDAFHVATMDARQGRDSFYSSEAVIFGSRITRNDFGMHMDGKGGFGLLNGLYQISGKQHVDNHTRIDHAYPNCESHELYKGVLDDEARGVFNGRIYVRQIAQKTDSKQTNRTLLLSKTAQINTNPQLEIFADDVKCTHGATVGQIDATQLYYLRSRGISLKQAQRMLVFAFANEMVEKINLAPLRAFLEKRLLAAQTVPGDLVEK